MWRYLKEAFIVRVDVPPLGRVPVNAVAATGLAILGFANPGFWLLGAALEAAVLAGLAFNPRFQNLVDGLALARDVRGADEKRQALVSGLPPASRERYGRLSIKCARILALYSEAEADAAVIETNREALRNLEWIHLKLLVANANLRAHAGENDRALAHRIDELEADLREEPAGTLRESKSSTLGILKKRLALWHRREESLDQIESDLARVEAQVDLLLENASLEGRPRLVSTEIELASELAGTSMFGDAEPAVAEVEEALATTRRAAAAAEKLAQRP